MILISKLNLNYISLHCFDKVVKYCGMYLCFKDGKCRFYLKKDNFMVEMTEFLPWEKEEYQSPYEANLKLQKAITALYPLLSNAELSAFVLACMSNIIKREETE